jgi:hypothetical protein
VEKVVDCWVEVVVRLSIITRLWAEVIMKESVILRLRFSSGGHQGGVGHRGVAALVE